VNEFNEFINVLIVDDSALMRKILSDILSSEPRIRVIGIARDGVECLTKMKQLSPDVIALDVEMPNKDGLAVLEEIMKTNPVPVVMVSSLTQENAQVTLKALALGCVDFVAKPSGSISMNMKDVGAELISKVVAAKGARVRPIGALPVRPEVRKPEPQAIYKKGKRDIIAIAASTGGPMALQHLLTNLPENLPVPIVITQHMPKDFTAPFAKRLDSICKLTVMEAEEGMDLKAGHAYIAPGGSHLLVKRRSDGTPYCGLSDAPPVLSVKPSANIMFLSVIDEFGGNVVAVILTGMGRDGADGAAGLRAKGAYIIAESQETCVVYGMPKAAVEAGAVDELLPLPDIPDALLRSIKG